MRTWWLLGVLACVAPVAPEIHGASGTWSIFIRLEGRERPTGGEWVALRCEGGVATVLDDVDGTINGGFIRGSLACWFGNDSLPRGMDWASPITGERRAASVILDDGYCVYSGTLVRPDSMGGTVRCMRDSGATELDQVGTWQATK